MPAWLIGVILFDLPIAQITTFFLYTVFEIQTVFYTYCKSQFGLIFQVLSRPMWLVALVLDSSALYPDLVYYSK